MVLFAAVGALLFWAANALDVERDTVIRIDRGEVTQLAAYWEAQAQRKPTPQEMKGLIQERIDEEVLYREALRLGLDKDDVIVRRRLAQKVSFLNEDMARVAEPGEAALQAFYRDNAARYSEPAFVSFDQVYFSPERRGARLDASVQAVLDDLVQHGGDPPANAGDPFMLPASNREMALDLLARDYGRVFADALRAMPEGRWSGSVESAFGMHIVRVTARRGDRPIPFADVRQRVREDYLAQRRRDANAAWLKRLRARYQVEIEGAAP